MYKIDKKTWHSCMLKLEGLLFFPARDGPHGAMLTSHLRRSFGRVSESVSPDHIFTGNTSDPSAVSWNPGRIGTHESHHREERLKDRHRHSTGPVAHPSPPPQHW